MDVRVHEAREDRGAGKVDGAIRGWRVARPDALDVPVVDQEPLARRLQRERVDARGAVEGLQRSSCSGAARESYQGRSRAEGLVTCRMRLPAR